MNYQKIYVSIVLRAKNECAVRDTNKNLNGAYYEVHHIIPKSLGGTNDKNNMVALTAREHFICHWLLAKIYPRGSIEQYKMLSALWRMRGESNAQHGKRYINSRTYELLRTEYRSLVSKYMSIIQAGTRNSQYGRHWYTNAYTGLCVNSPDELDYPWIRGRNLFRGESNRVGAMKCCHTSSNMVMHSSKCIRTSTDTMSSRTMYARQQTYREWDKFHSSNYKSLGDWSRKNGITYQAIVKRFRKFIPIFNKLIDHGKPFASNQSLVGVYNWTDNSMVRVPDSLK